MIDGFILLIAFVLIFCFIGAYFLLDEKNSKSALLKSFFSSLAILVIIILFLIIG